MQRIQPDQNNFEERRPAEAKVSSLAKFSSFADDGGASRGTVSSSDGGIVALTLLQMAGGKAMPPLESHAALEKMCELLHTPTL